MEIHSSSLSYNPTGLNPRQNGQSNSAQDKQSELEAETATDKQQQPFQPTQVESILNSAGLLLLPEEPSNSQNNATNSRSQQAVNAYTSEVNQPLKDQRENLIVGIDIYV